MSKTLFQNEIWKITFQYAEFFKSNKEHALCLYRYDKEVVLFWEEIKEKDEEGKEKKARTPLHHCMSMYSYHMKKLYKQEKGFDVQFYSKHANMRIPDYIYDKLVYFAKMKRLF